MELLKNLPHMFTDICSNATVLTALVTVLIIVWYSYSGVPKQLPPGPLGLPIVGYMPFLGKASRHEEFNNLAKKYGPVFSLYLGNRLVVVLNSYEAIKEAFVKQGEVFAGRPRLQFTFSDPDPYSIIASDGDIWKVHRRFALNLLRDLGVGKMSIEPQIMEEIQFFLNELKKLNARPCNFSSQLTASVSNNICILIFGKRFDYEDAWFIFARHLIDELVAVASATSVWTFFPWLLKFPGMSKIFKQESLVNMTEEFKNSIYSRIVEAKKNYTDGERDNYMKAFVGEQKARKQSAPNEEIFPDEALEQNLRGLLGAGTETTANTLLWCILYMALHTEVQTRVQKEINDVIGTDRAPCWNDRLRTPYTEATINEILRMTTLVPTSIPHKNTRDCEIFGYKIPKDTFIVPNLWAVHNDANLWQNPTEFRPERFLTADGTFQKSEHLIPFSLGKRECLGISLAKMELYLYFATMLQKFTFKSPDGSKPSLESSVGFTTRPKYFNIMAIPKDTN